MKNLILLFIYLPLTISANEILIAVAERGFDPTEAGASVQVLTGLGHNVTLTTQSGKTPITDMIMITGENLGPESSKLKIQPNGLMAYQLMMKLISTKKLKIVPFNKIKPGDYDGLILTGGHSKAMKKTYLEDPTLRSKVLAIYESGKIIGAICHGPVVLARTMKNGRSIIYGREVTALPEIMEKTAWKWSYESLTKAGIEIDPVTKKSTYYLTYPGKTVQSEIETAVSDKGDFLTGLNVFSFTWLRDLMGWRDSLDDLDGFYVKDGQFITARYPGDAFTFATEFSKMVKNNK